MLSVIIATHESERTLVRTLTPLVAGATAGLIAEVIVIDAGSRDATAEVADIAGCRFVHSDAPPGARLNDAAQLARAPWLLFLRPGTVPEPGWLEAVEAFMQSGGTAAAFRRPAGGLFAGLRLRRVGPSQGLLITKTAYLAAGGHAPHGDAEAALLRKLGRIALLAAAVRPTKDTI